MLVHGFRTKMRGVWRTAAEKMMAREIEVTCFAQRDNTSSYADILDKETENSAHSTDISIFSLDLNKEGVYKCGSCNKHVTAVQKCGAISCEAQYCSDCEIKTRSSVLFCFYCKTCSSQVHEWFKGNFNEVAAPLILILFLFAVFS